MVLTAVLTKEPPALASHGVQIPAGLERIVLRLLAKQRERRYASYAELREALQPYSSQGVTTATLARRLGAIVLDLLLLSLPTSLFAARFLQWSLASPLLSVVPKLALLILYFGALEGWWGRTIGKRLFGVRVTTVGGAPASPARAFARAAVFVLLYSVPTITSSVITSAGRSESLHLTGFLSLIAGMQVLSVVLLLSTMRRRNGFACVHDLLTGTRVVLAEERRAGVDVRDADEADAVQPTASSARFGAYRATGTLWQRDGESLVLARDDELGRAVWIHAYRDTTAVPPVERLHARRPGCLPWLQRSVDASPSWDAYGAPRGRALTRWVRDRGPLSWTEMREVVTSIAEELKARLETDDTCGTLSLSHVWIDPEGRAILLPFAATVPDALEPMGAAECTRDGWRGFLARVVSLGLTGEPSAAPPASPPPIPLPGHAGAVVAPLYGSDAAYASPEALLDAVRQGRGRADRVTRVRRAAVMLIALAPIAVPAFGYVISRVQMASAPAWIIDLQSVSGPYGKLLAQAQRDTTGDTTSRNTLGAIQVLLSSAYDSAMASPQMGRTLLQLLPPTYRAMIDEAARAHPTPSAGDVAEARAWMTSHFGGGGPLVVTGGQVTVVQVLGAALFLIGIFGMMSVVVALLLRDGLALRMSGVTIRRLDGSLPGRWRCVARAALAWSPALLATVSVIRHNAVLPVVLAVLLVAGAAWCLVRPDRGPADLLAGTVLVPR